MTKTHVIWFYIVHDVFVVRRLIVFETFQETVIKFNLYFKKTCFKHLTQL